MGLVFSTRIIVFLLLLLLRLEHCIDFELFVLVSFSFKILQGSICKYLTAEKQTYI